MFRNFPTAVMLGNNGLALFAELFKATDTDAQDGRADARQRQLRRGHGEGHQRLRPACRPALQDRRGHRLFAADQRPLGRSRQGEGRQRRHPGGRAPPQRHHPDDPRDGEAELSAHGHHQPRQPGHAVQRSSSRRSENMRTTASPTSPGSIRSSPCPRGSNAAFTKAHPDEFCTLEIGFTFEGHPDLRRRRQARRVDQSASARRGTEGDATSPTG